MSRFIRLLYSMHPITFEHIRSNPPPSELCTKTSYILKLCSRSEINEKNAKIMFLIPFNAFTKLCLVKSEESLTFRSIQPFSQLVSFTFVSNNSWTRADRIGGKAVSVIAKGTTQNSTKSNNEKCNFVQILHRKCVGINTE